MTDQKLLFKQRETILMLEKHVRQLEQVCKELHESRSEIIEATGAVVCGWAMANVMGMMQPALTEDELNSIMKAATE